MEKFWKSFNKTSLLQSIAKTKVSGQVLEDSFHFNETNAISDHAVYKELPELASSLEEADMRLIPHIKWHLQNYPGCLICLR